MIKIVLLPVRNAFLGLNEGISEKVCQVAQKHTTNLKLIHNNVKSSLSS